MPNCALPDCQKPFTIGYGVCCRRSHQNIFSALIRHGKINNPVVKDRIGVRDSFIGPAKPKHLRIKKQKYVPTKELSPEQQEKRRRRNLMYHHRVRQATMSWTNMNLIEEFYQQAQILTKKNWDKARSRPYCSFEGKNCVWPSCTG